MANVLLDPAQHGFIQRRATCTQLLHMCHDLALYRNSHTPFQHVHFGQKAAFDRVPHEWLLSKMETLGIHPKSISECREFLGDRLFCVGVNDAFSDSLPAPIGVPQKGCMSPLMYTIHVLETRDFIPAGVRHFIFADDLRNYAPVDSLGSHQSCCKCHAML